MRQVHPHERGSLEELQLELIQIILEALDNEREYL